MADIAAVFHWPPDAMRAMSLRAMLEWQQRAISRWNRMNAAEE